MDSETQRFSGAEPARVNDPANPQAQQPPAGNPTSYLPPYSPPQPTADSAATTALPPNGAPTGANQSSRPMGYVAPPTNNASAPFSVGSLSGPNLGAIVLIVIGLFILLRQGTDSHILGSAIPMFMGLVFLYLYQQKGQYGYLVPGCIMTGLGAGIILNSILPDGGGAVPFGLGLGFLALWVVQRAQWWWLVPGGILTLVGLDSLMDNFVFSTGIIAPVIFIVAGAFLLFRRQPAKP